ncbi:MAG: HAMP domain-containing protein [Thermonemataceae bacterium]
MAKNRKGKLRIELFSIQTKTTLIILLLSLLTIANVLFVFYSNRQLSRNALTVEVARRNEVVSQKLSFLASSVFSGNEARKKELQSSITKHDYNLSILEEGGDISLAEHQLTVTPTTDEVRTKLIEVKTLWRSYRENLFTVLNQQPLITQIDSTVTDEGKVSYQVRKVPNKVREEAMGYIRDNTLNLFIQNSELSDFYLGRFLSHKERTDVTIFVFFLLYILLFSIAFYQLIQSFVKPVRKIEKATQKLAKGDFNTKIDIKQKGEIGRITQNINLLSENLRAASSFALAIGDAKFDVPFNKKGDDDKLAEALLGMRDNLRKVDEESQRRRWTNEGVTLFNDILRANFDEFDEFAYQIIYNLVTYLGVNQGAFFSIVSNQQKDQFSLQINAAYAFDRRRYEEKTITLEEGLLAQAVSEKDIIYLTDVPDNYIEITSGLGDAPPSVLLIIPLISEKEVYGAIELASFNQLADYELAFAQRIAGMVASTIATVRMNENTKQLLEDAKEYAQQMRAQEEEMRQNMEELATTQETLEKREKEKSDALSKLKEEYDARIEEIYQKERILRDQKTRLQEALDTANDKNTQVEKQQEDLRVALEKFKNKENLLLDTIKCKDTEIE